MRTAALLLFTSLTALPITAADVSPLKATELAVCVEVVDRGCEGPGLTFDSREESLAFLTRIEGATGEAFVVHVWRFESKEVRRVRLPVKAPSYRTWSTKKIKGLSGKWRVEVFDPVGRPLGAVDFVVEPAQNEP